MRYFRRQIGFKQHAARPERSFQQDAGIPHDRIDIHRPEVAASHAGKIKQAVHDLGGAEGLLRDLVQHRLQACLRVIVATQLFAQHLRVAGYHRERRVHLVRYSRREQTDGGELLRLRELRFHVDAVCDVVHDHDAADGAKPFIE